VSRRDRQRLDDILAAINAIRAHLSGATMIDHGDATINDHGAGSVGVLSHR